MTPDQRRRVRDLFEAAVDRDPWEIAGWLDSAAGDDSQVRAEVKSLLNHHSRAGRFLAEPLLESAPHLLVEDHALDPGTVLGTYTVIRELGRGGMGRVYLASDARLGRTVALKAVAPELTREPGHRERLRREARAAAGLTHPGICTVYALEEFDGELYIATEFVEGNTLREEIRAQQPPVMETVVATARELASGLASAHAKGITHRDLKPENIMRTADGRIKILDFGLARIEKPVGAEGATLTNTLPGTLAGTPAYMSPEQIEGGPVGPPTDVFAFGVLFYEWISGTHPFLAGSALATLARVIDSSPEPLATRANAPVWLSDVIQRCLSKSPTDRYASGAELLRALESPAVAVRRAPGSNLWWRTHQVALMVLYVLATTLAWEIKEWQHTPLSLWAFVLMGVAASVAGIIRGHLLFTDVVNRPHLTSELHRTRPVALTFDLLASGTLLADALFLASVRPLAAVLTICVAIGIALATVLMEPATTAAVFGEQPVS